MKILKWLDKNILFLFTLFLLAFIPLYPKLPLLDVKHTWVYIRIEDFLVALAVLIWFIQLLRKKASLKTPLTIPIFLFWIVGIISTISAIIFIFPNLNNVFPNIAFLHLFRRLEYLSVFFIAYSAIKNVKQLKYVIAFITVTLLLVSVYGFGQRGFFIGFENRLPAFSTMNEEFAKGVPLLISAANRVQSTFAGHYDLAAYLVMVIPIMGALAFGIKKWIGKILFIFASGMGLVLLLMTASRVSFAVYLLTISFMLVLHKQKKFIIPVIVLSIMLMTTFQGMAQRFAGTVQQVDLIIDARTGEQIGVGKESEDETGKYVINKEQDTGEDLKTGSSYVVPVSKNDDKTTKSITIKRQVIKAGEISTEETGVEGNFIVKKALAYDISFTTRFQGTWPRAIEAFKRNIILGSGYSSISLASDNNYLRILGEVGLAGLMSYFLIFIILSIYAYRVFPEIDSKLARSFVIGVMAGIFGLSLNAVLIDVFEASKVAFILWLLIGLTAGLLHLYQKSKINYLNELRILFSSIPVLAVYLFILTMGVFAVTFQNYFVADDFTWLRWAADCKKIFISVDFSKCEPITNTFINYFSNSKDFFYRPGTKIYFYFLYNYSWLNANVYHIVSVLIHFAVTVLVMLISNKVLRNKFFSFITAFLFLVLSSHSEAVLWISSVGHMISALFILSGLLFHIYWRETKNKLYLLPVVLSIFAAPLFQETGIMAAPLIVLFDLFIIQKNINKKSFKTIEYLLYILFIPIYLIMRALADSFWSGGDYSYNLIKLPFNFIGNLLGYIPLIAIGTDFISIYDQIRNYSRENIVLSVLVSFILAAVLILVIKLVHKKIKLDTKKQIYAGLIFFIIPLIPILGLGNATLRYSYLASFGVILLFVIIIKSIFSFIFKFNKFASVAIITILILMVSYLQITELYESNQDWKRAGEITNNLLIGMNYTFAAQKAIPVNPVFYFVNVPIKTGEAWVFPVGLDDALWFTFQDTNLNTHRLDDLELALDAAEGSTSARVFEFNQNGKIEEVSRTNEISPIQ